MDGSRTADATIARASAGGGGISSAAYSAAFAHLMTANSQMGGHPTHATVPDVRATVFNAMLRFMYTGRVELTLLSAMELYTVGLPPLFLSFFCRVLPSFSLCEIRSRNTSETMVSIFFCVAFPPLQPPFLLLYLQASKQYEIEALRDICYRFIDTRVIQAHADADKSSESQAGTEPKGGGNEATYAYNARNGMDGFGHRFSPRVVLRLLEFAVRHKWSVLMLL